MKKNTKTKIIIILILFTLFNINIAFSYSKYISNSIWNYFLKSKEFYFSSDLLDKETKININTLWDGGKTFFSVKNALNNTSITKYDINFTVECKVLGEQEQNFKCVLIDTDQSKLNQTLSSYESCFNNTNNGIIVSNLSKQECELQNYEWVSQISNLEYYFDIIPLKGIEPKDVKVRIEANVTSPYKTNLSGEFSLHKTNKTSDYIKTEYRPGNLFEKLIISNSYTENKCINVQWDSNEYRLYTEENILLKYADQQGYINKIRIELNKKESHTLEFQKTNKQKEGDINLFTIKEVNC